MFKRILVAVDGSPTALRGLKLALALAKQHEATLHVLHVVDDMVVAQGYDGAAWVAPQYVDDLLSGMREAGRKVLARAVKLGEAEGQPVQPVLVETLGKSVAHAILDKARKLRVELIVLGTHGRRGLSRLVMGSDAETIVREATVPVLLVRTPQKAAPARAAAPKSAPSRKVTARSGSA